MKVIYKKGKHNPCMCDECLSAYYFQPCSGCKEGHSSFWRTVTLSPQWARWQVEQTKRFHNWKKIKKPCYDMDEVCELGVISQGHFQEFLKFIR